MHIFRAILIIPVTLKFVTFYRSKRFSILLLNLHSHPHGSVKGKHVTIKTYAAILTSLDTRYFCLPLLLLE